MDYLKKPQIYCGDFFQHFKYSDIIFDINGVLIFAIKGNLGRVSPVFDAMFSNDFIEKQSKKIALPSKDVMSFHHFMELLHKPCMDIDSKYLKDIIMLAEEYQIVDLKDKAEINLIQSFDLWDYAFALKYNLVNLCDAITKFIERNKVQEMDCEKLFESLTPGEGRLSRCFYNKCEEYENALVSFGLLYHNEFIRIISNGNDMFFVFELFLLTHHGRIVSGNYFYCGNSWKAEFQIEGRKFGIILYNTCDKEGYEARCTLVNYKCSENSIEKRLKLCSDATWRCENFMLLDNLSKEFLFDGKLNVKIDIEEI